MDRFFANGRQGLGTGLIDLDTAVIKAALLRGYTYNAAHTFVSDVTGAGGTIVGTPAALSSVTFADGVLDSATDPSFAAVAAGAAIDALLLYQASAVGGGADIAASSQRLVAILDGKVRVTVAAAAGGGATALTIDPVPLALASGAVGARITGAGPATVTLSAGASADARSLAVTATGGAIAAGDVYEFPYSAANLPITPNGGDINVVFSNGANRIIRI